jgi:hypothetical protein
MLTKILFGIFCLFGLAALVWVYLGDAFWGSGGGDHHE